VINPLVEAVRGIWPGVIRYLGDRKAMAPFSRTGRAADIHRGRRCQAKDPIKCGFLDMGTLTREVVLCMKK